MLERRAAGSGLALPRTTWVNWRSTRGAHTHADEPETDMSVRLGLFYPNARSVHALSGAIAASNPDVCDLDAHVAVAQAAEAVGFDYLFAMDAWGPFGPQSTAVEVMDPMLLAPVLAASLFSSTRHIRFITTVHTSWFHPLQLARLGGTLDTLSKGRWGMNVVSGDGFAGKLQGAPSAELDHDARYVRAAETIEILTQAWSNGCIDFDGEHFSIHGALVGPRTRQHPRPLVVGAGASDAGIQFAGRYADFVFMPGRTPLHECRRRMDAIRAVAGRNGRNGNDVRLQMHASVLVRETDAEAQAASKALEEAVDLPIVAEYLNAVRTSISTYDDIYAAMGDLEMRKIGSVSGARRVHGGPAQVADEIETLVTAFGCSGIAVTLPVWSPTEIHRFGRLVLPVLEARGLWRHPRTRDWSW